MKKSIIKAISIHLALGILGVVVIGLFMYFISLDLRWSMVVGVVVFFSLGWLTTRNHLNPYLKLLVSSIPPAIFYYLILAELPNLYFIIPLIVLCTLVGYWVSMKGVSFNVKLSSAISILLILIAGYNFIPLLVQQHLAEVVNEPSPDFHFMNLEGEEVTKSDLNGKIVILDFFGTWCKPCIAELKELAPIISQYNEVAFYVVNSGQGGDTVEKTKVFAEKRGYDFAYGFDHEGQVHKAFGFTGVPALVILDQSGNVRLKNEGYNSSEDIHQIISRTLDQLLKE